MSNVLLVEPDYRSKFPPLGLFRISTFHKSRGDHVIFTRGNDGQLCSIAWHRIYVSSLYTWELPRTIETIKFYSRSLHATSSIIVGGIAATLMPEYIKKHVQCKIVTGLLDTPNRLGKGTAAIGKLPPDYTLLERSTYQYTPSDAYFVRASKGCPRRCSFCAVPQLEKEFGSYQDLRRQVSDVQRTHGDKQMLVVLDNNILGLDNFEDIVRTIADLGFQANARRGGRRRAVDFNQGIDARIIARKPSLAKCLSSICLSPVRLAYDNVRVERAYRKAVIALHEWGFTKFTTYMLFNYDDDPQSFYKRIHDHAEMNSQLRIRITGFPMRFIPTNAVDRKYVSPKWEWKLLRGIQCVLIATHGLVSPNPEFISRAFGSSFSQFIEILSMPDRYIIYRSTYEHQGADDWRAQYCRLTTNQKTELLVALHELNANQKQRCDLLQMYKGRLRRILEHYYPNGKAAPKRPIDDKTIKLY